MAEDTVKVIIAFDPNNRDREGKTESLPAAEAHSLVYNGRARYADGDESKAKKDAPTPNVAPGALA